MNTNFTTIDKFKFYCQKILPLVYDDSLSYYETLCKLTCVLNDVIENINNIPEYIQSLVSDERLKDILANLLNSLEEQIASANEKTSETATADRNVGDMVWLNGLLYRCIKQMDNGDKYVVNNNIEKITIETLYNEIQKTFCDYIENSAIIASKTISKGTWLWYNNKLCLVTKDIEQGSAYVAGTNFIEINVADMLNDEIENRKNGDVELHTEIEVEQNDRVMAINNLSTSLQNETNNRIEADTELRNNINTLKKDVIYKSIEDYGALSSKDDNTESIQNAINDCSSNGYILVIPNKTYKTSKLILKDGTVIMGVDMNKSILEFTKDGFIGDPTNNYFYNGGYIENITIIGNNTDTSQNGFDVCMITSKINKCIARYFKGVGFNMREPVSAEIYQPLVNMGEAHGLTNCSASFCGTGFYLHTWDSLNDDIVSSRCENGIDIASAKLSNAHVWGFIGFGINCENDIQMSNVEIEAAIVTTISGALILNGTNVSINGVRIWNVNVNKFLIWSNNSSNNTIENLIIGPAGNLTNEDTTTVQVIGGTANNLFVKGVIDSSYTKGVGYSVSGSGTYLLTGNANITNVVYPNNGVMLYNHTVSLTKTIAYAGTAVNLSSVITEYTNFDIIGAKIIGYNGNGWCRIYTFNSTYFMLLYDADNHLLPSGTSYTVKFDLYI